MILILLFYYSGKMTVWTNLEKRHEPNIIKRKGKSLKVMREEDLPIDIYYNKLLGKLTIFVPM